MKYLFYVCIFTAMFSNSLLFGATIEPGDSSKRHKTDYVTNWTQEETQVYTVSASASGCSFVDKKTKSSSDATLKSHSSSHASAEKSIEHTDTPNTSGFGFSVSGVLAGSGEGSEVTWSATLQQKFFWLTPMEKIVAEGTAVTVSANGAPTESAWKINNRVWKNWSSNSSEAYKVSSITLNRDMWDKMKWIPNPVPDNWKCPPAGVYNISATTTEEFPDTPRSASATVTVLGLQDVRVRQVGSSSTQNVVVKKGDKINISVTALPSDTIDGEVLPFRWSIRQMQSSGDYNSWISISVGDDKSSFEYTTTKGGIFQVKVEVEKYDIHLEECLKRQTDDEHSDLKKGALDAFGVCDDSYGLLLWLKASSQLGKDTWRMWQTYTIPGTNFTYPDTENKCNVFIYEMAKNTGLKVPLTGGYMPPYWPPSANQWAGEDLSLRLNFRWPYFENAPQPGKMWARPGNTSGHCGVIDYDGRVISAQSSNGLIGRRENDINQTKRYYKP